MMTEREFHGTVQGVVLAGLAISGTLYSEMGAEALTMAPVIWPLIFPLGLALLWEYRHREREFQSRSKFVIASMLIGGLLAVPYCLIVGGLFWGVIRGETLLAFGVCTLAGGSVLGASIAWSVWSPKKKTCCDQ